MSAWIAQLLECVVLAALVAGALYAFLHAASDVACGQMQAS